MQSYSFSFFTNKPAKDVFERLINVGSWWSGIYNETITGKSESMGDEFSFSAGGGMHFTIQKLIELVPYKKIVWQVVDSNLSFLNSPKEWDNTKLVFDILEMENDTQVIFTHDGLVPQIECYSQCTNAWTQYFQQLQEKLKN